MTLDQAPPAVWDALIAARLVMRRVGDRTGGVCELEELPAAADWSDDGRLVVFTYAGAEFGYAAETGIVVERRDGGESVWNRLGQLESNGPVPLVLTRPRLEDELAAVARITSGVARGFFDEGP